jgi:redox-sensitive bicupin YhaK (pirin superfamily)
MLTIRRSADRGFFDHGWLKTHHSFSFGRYIDRAHMGFRTLRVINEDIVAPSMGFGEHGHEDMEILTYPLSGAVRHRDSLGHQEDITHGMVQRMTAGSGIRHSEFNPSRTEPTHMLQIWITPREGALAPAHESRRFPIAEQPGRLHLLASPDGAEGSLAIQQDARMLAGVFAKGDAATLPLAPGRHAWVQVAWGSVRVNGQPLSAGDGAAISDEEAVELAFDGDGEVLVFDLA